MDECGGPAVARWLHEQGHEVFSLYEEAHGLDDDSVIAKALAVNWILVTADKGFGDKIFRERRPHRGVVLLRLEDERAQSKIAALRRLIEGHAEQLAN